MHYHPEVETSKEFKDLNIGDIFIVLEYTQFNRGYGKLLQKGVFRSCIGAWDIQDSKEVEVDGDCRVIPVKIKISIE